MSALELTKQLVSFKSPSHVSNSKVSQFIANEIQALGFEIELQTYVDERGVEKVNVLAKKGPDNQRAGLAYFCHSDVVPAETWTGPGGAYSPIEEQGRLYGRGSCDMKGSAACMLAAIDRLKEKELKAPLYFVCTADEELCYAGARELVHSSPMYREMVQRQARVLIGEPTQLEVIYAHKGICNLTITSRGEAAHSSSREGLNANLAMIPFLQEMKAIHDETESLEAFQNHEFDPPSVSWNIGINDGNTAINVKAGESICTIFFRPVPGFDKAALIKRVEEAARQHGLELRVGGQCDAVYTDPASEFVQEALGIAGVEQAKTVSYGTDAGELTELKNKIVCGPGNIAQAHTTDEWIELEQLSLGCDLYERFVRQWCLEF